MLPRPTALSSALMAGRR